jgi:hypothetical protein
VFTARYALELYIQLRLVFSLICLLSRCACSFAERLFVSRRASVASPCTLNRLSQSVTKDLSSH